LYVLGIDVSTSVTAYTLINTECSQSDCLVKTEGIHLSKLSGIYNKADHVREHFEKLAKEYDIEEIYIEEALQSFRRGFSSAKTLSTLAMFNGIISYLAFKTFTDSEIALINVIRARSSLGIKLNRKSDKNTKEQVFEWVQKRKEFENFTWPTKVLKSGPRKGQEIFDKSCYDIADAAVMAMYGINLRAN